jgi:hypothetical protein
MRSVLELLPFVVVAVAVVAGLVQVFGGSDVYEQIGRGGLSLHEGAPAPSGSQAERDDDIRQMLAARNARRARQGREALDVESELGRLTGRAPVARTAEHRGAGADPELEREVRELVIARNARRARRGEAPLDVEAEVRRQLREL